MRSIFSVSGNLGSESLSLHDRKTIVIAAITIFDGGRFCEYWNKSGTGPMSLWFLWVALSCASFY